MEDKRRYNPLQSCKVIILQLIKKIKKKKKKEEDTQQAGYKGKESQEFRTPRCPVNRLA